MYYNYTAVDKHVNYFHKLCGMRLMDSGKVDSADSTHLLLSEQNRLVTVSNQ